MDCVISFTVKRVKKGFTVYNLSAIGYKKSGHDCKIWFQLDKDCVSWCPSVMDAAKRQNVLQELYCSFLFNTSSHFLS